MSISTMMMSLRVFGWLLWADVRFLWKDFFDNLLDAIVWPIAVILINGFIAPALGMPADYGAFASVSMVVIMGAYNAWAGSMLIAADLAGDKTIAYELTLPLPYWMVWIKNGLYLSIKAAVFNMTPLFFGKLFLGDAFDLSNMSVGYFLAVYSVASLFFGMFALWSTVIVKTAEGHTRLELRLIGPMFFVNGWVASWAVMYAVSPAFGIIVRCLPWIYAYEGCRAAILGQDGYLNIWLCIGMLIFFTVLITSISIWLFKKRMDCV